MRYLERSERRSQQVERNTGWAVLVVAFGLAISLSGSSLLSASHAAALPAVPKELRDRLILEAKPFVKTIDRPYLISHYTHRSDVKVSLTGPVNPKDPLFSAYVSRSLKSFQRGSKDDDVVGSGMYFAIDPLVSRSYGGKNWVLIQGEIKVGAKVLDLTEGSGFLSDTLQASMAKWGCDAWRLEEIFEKDIEPGCQALRLELSRAPELGVQGLYYTFVGAGFPNCHEDGAFLVWNSSFFTAIEAFTSGVSVPHTQDPQFAHKAELQSLFDYLFEEGNSIFPDESKKPTLYPELKSADSSRLAQSWLKRYGFGCQEE